MIGGVPMQWMQIWAGQHAIFFDRAKGNRIWDVDGNELLDFCLGDTGAMAGHSPDATVAAVQRRMGDLGGVTTMLPTEDAIWVADELSRRFGMAKWTFSLTATDANRWVLRTCRQLTGRPKVLIYSYCYHGSVDETIIALEGGVPTAKPGNVGPQVDPAQTTRVVEFNDLAMLERELAHGDVACVLAEPALTNMGIVLPDPGYWEAATRLIRDAGAYLVDSLRRDRLHLLSGFDEVVPRLDRCSDADLFEDVGAVRVENDVQLVPHAVPLAVQRLRVQRRRLDEVSLFILKVVVVRNERRRGRLEQLAHLADLDVRDIRKAATRRNRHN